MIQKNSNRELDKTNEKIVDILEGQNKIEDEDQKN